MAVDFNNEMKQQYADQGYLVIDSGLDDATLNGAIEDASPYFGESRPKPLDVPHADHGRVQDAWYVSEHIYKIATAPNILEVLQKLYGQPAKPFQTLNFYRGTQQPVHSDTIHFNSEPFGKVCGVWTALEDISQDQGPVVYYPGSHLLPEMNYDFFGLEADYDQSYSSYLDELQKVINKSGYKAQYATIKKGQSFIWAANLLHGGARQNNINLTRHSQVTHFYLEDAKPWRPSLSQEERSYFQPQYIDDWRGTPFLAPAPFPQPVPLARRALNFIKRKIV